jgi:hypothetical protein
MSSTAAFPLRVPADVKVWMEDQAQLNRSSQNSEVVRALRAAMARNVQEARAE